MPAPLTAAFADLWPRALAELSLPLILGCAALALAWLLPGHYLPWTLFQQETCAAVAGLLICLAVIQSRSPIHWPPVAWVAAAAAALPWLQFACGQIRFLDDAVLPSAYLLALAMAVGAGASLARSRLLPPLVEGLTGAFVAAAVLSTGIALHQWLDLPPVGDWIAQAPPWERPYANLSQPNHLSSALALGLAGVLRWYETRRIGAGACLLAVAWLAWGIALTQSRTGWLFILLLGAGCLLLRRRARLQTPPLAASGGLLAFAAMVLLNGPLKALWLQSSEAALAVRTEAGTRLLHWQALADAALQSPWFGYGWNQVTHAQYDVVLTHPASGENVAHSHNLVLDLILYNGMPLAALMVLGLAAWVLRAVRECRDGSTWCLLAALLALLTHAMLEYPLHYFYFLLPAGLLVGVLDAPAHAGERASSRAPRATFWVPTLLMSALLIWVGVEYMRAEEALRRLRFASARIGITLADLRSPDLVLLQGWKSYHDAALIKLREGMAAEELALLRDIARRYSYPPALQRYAYALALNGDRGQARKVLARMCKIYPEPVQGAMREAWGEQQAKTPSLRAVDFPDCTG